MLAHLLRSAATGLRLLQRHPQKSKMMLPDFLYLILIGWLVIFLRSDAVSEYLGVHLIGPGASLIHLIGFQLLMTLVRSWMLIVFGLCGGDGQQSNTTVPTITF